MLKKLVAMSMLVATASFAYGQAVTYTLDDDSANAGAGFAGGDIALSGYGSGDLYATSNLQGSAFNGATFVYHTDANDQPLATEPGTGDKWVTFQSLPRGKDVAARFKAAGAPTVVDASLNLGATDVYLETFDFPPLDGDTDGYTQRIVIDYSGAGVTHAVAFGAVAPGTAVQILASGTYGAGTNDFPANWQTNGTTWAFWEVPEPSALALLALGGLAAFRRR